MRDDASWSNLLKQGTGDAVEKERNRQQRSKRRGPNTHSGVLRTGKLARVCSRLHSLWYCGLCSGPHLCWPVLYHWATPQLLLHRLFQKVREVHKCAKMHYEEAGWAEKITKWLETTQLYDLWGLKGESEVCFSMINEGVALFPPVETKYFLPQLRSPLLHLQSHPAKITICLYCHLCSSSKNP